VVVTARDLDNLDLAQARQGDGRELESVVLRVLVESEFSFVSL